MPDVIKPRRIRPVNKLTRMRQKHAILRRKDAWALALKGASCRQIALQLGVSKMQISRDLRAVIAEETALTRKSIEEYRTLEEARLNRLDLALATQTDKGFVPAVRESRKLSESRRRLLGIDAPLKSEQNINSSNTIQVEAVELTLEQVEQRLRLLAQALQTRARTGEDHVGAIIDVSAVSSVAVATASTTTSTPESTVELVERNASKTSESPDENTLHVR